MTFELNNWGLTPEKCINSKVVAGTIPRTDFRTSLKCFKLIFFKTKIFETTFERTMLKLMPIQKNSDFNI